MTFSFKNMSSPDTWRMALNSIIHARSRGSVPVPQHDSCFYSATDPPGQALDRVHRATPVTLTYRCLDCYYWTYHSRIIDIDVCTLVSSQVIERSRIFFRCLVFSSCQATHKSTRTHDRFSYFSNVSAQGNVSGFNLTRWHTLSIYIYMLETTSTN